MLSIDNKPDNVDLFKLKIEPSHLFIYLLFIPMLMVYHWATGYEQADILKSIFYFLPLFGVIVLFVYNFFAFERKLKLNLSLIQLTFAYALIVAIGLFLNSDDIYQSTFYRDIIIITLPLFLFAFDWKFTENQFNWLFVGAMVSFLLWKKFKIEWSFLSTILFTSRSDSEYHFGCVAGVFFIYYLYKKKWLWLLVSLFFMSLVNKRSNILGLMSAIPIYYIIVSPLKLYDKKIWFFGFLLTYYVFFWVLGTNIEYLGTFFLKLVGKGEMDLDHFLTGRMILVNQLQPEILDRGFFSFLFGNGPGQAEVFLWKTMRHHEIYRWEARPFLVHNDFLKLQFEVGLIGTLLYMFVLYYLYSGSKLGIFIFLYAIPLFLIDNTVIYLYNILVGCVAARVIDNSDSNETNFLSPFFRFFRRG